MNEFELPKWTEIDLAKVTSQLDNLLSLNLNTLDVLLKQPAPFTWRNLLLPLEELDDKLHQFWAPISHLHSVADSDYLREIYNQCLPKLTDYHMAISHNYQLYEAIQSIAASEEYTQLNQAQKKVIQNNLRDFKLAGVALPKEQQERFTQLLKDLSQLSTKFEENVLDATKAWTKLITDPTALRGIPEITLHALEEAAKKVNKEGWLLNLEPPNFIAVITYADSRELRQEIYTANVTRASDLGPQAGQFDNQQIMNTILEKRLEVAHLLGFENYAEESLAVKMAKSPEEVLAFLNKLQTAALPKAKQDIEQLKEFAKQHFNIEALQPWDLAYISEKLRQASYAISQEELRPYFPEYQVLNGLFTIIKRLYGMTIMSVPNADTWHPDARCYVITDESGELRSFVYIDLYARSNKRGGAWMDDCRVRRQKQNGEMQAPIAFVNCNFSGPAKDRPALFTHDEVITLFHEFGHALQHMLTKVDYADVSGINGIPWDAVELASQFFENWAWEHEAVNLIAEHYQSKEPLPEELYQKMIRAKNFQAAVQIVRQVEFALYDFRLHMEFDLNKNNQTQTILDEVRAKAQLLPVPAFNRFQNSFSHIFAGGYAAGYYSYHWAQVLASDAFELFKEQGIFNSDISHKFLSTILETGGSEEPMDLFIRFRGRPPEVEALLRDHGII